MIETRIIIVEDEWLAAETIKNMLHAIDIFNITTYSQAESALNELNKQNSDLVIMDINLSTAMSGLEAADIIQQKHGIPVVFVTAYTDNITIKKMIELNSYGFIPKPVNESIFNYVIKTALKRIETDRLLEIKTNDLVLYKEKLEDIIKIRTKSLTEINISLENEINLRKGIKEELLNKTETIEEDMESAQQMQRSFLPEVPHCSFAEMSYRYIPARAVGGDFLSITPLQEGGIGIFVGDVSGHGVSAALITAMIKSISNRICRQHGSSPGQYMENLNSELIPELNDETFLTAFYCVLKETPLNVQCLCSRGGHPAPILWRKETNSIELIETWGLLLGSFEESTYKEETINLLKGDRLFIFTDGINESQNAKKEMLNHEGIIEIIQSNSYENAAIDQTLDKIIDKAQKLRNDGPFEDDMLVIGIEIT